MSDGIEIQRSCKLPFVCRHLVLACLIPVLILPGSVHGDSPTSDIVESENSPQPAGFSEAEIAQKQEKIQQRIRRLHEVSEESNGLEQLPQLVKEELDTLSWLDLTYSQLVALREQTRSSKQELEDAKGDWESLAKFGIGQPAPYSYLLLDEIRADLLKQQSRLASLKARESTTVHSLNEAKTALKEADGRRRLASEELAQEQQVDQRAARQNEYDRALLVCEARKAALEQLRAESEIQQLGIRTTSQRIRILEEKQRIVSAEVVFSEAEFESRMKLMDETEKELRDDMSEKLRQLARWQPSPSSSNQSAGGPPSGGEQLRRTRFKLRQQEVSLAQQMLRELVEVRAAWRWRYQLANESVSVQQLHEWQQLMQNAQVRIASLSTTLASKLDELRDQSLALRKVMMANAGVAEDANIRNTRLQIEELEKATTFLSDYVTLTRAGTRLFQLALDDTNRALAPSSRQSLLKSVAYWTQKVWNYEIAVVDDRSITIGKILCALGLLFGGLLLARVFSRMLGSRILPRLGVNQAGAFALQKIVFYVLICFFTLIVLELVNVPVTGFAFMGGAIAIGVGFGSQNIINNFISGLILLAEQPIRTGDLVEIDGLSANIEHIGARSTRVRTGSNLEIVVPNSTFLENNVTNWTLSNTRIRVSVSVGVAYGSDTRVVMDCLRQAATEHPAVLSDGELIILFKEFGDNALLFECHSWIHMRTMMEGEKVCSDIRCRIDALMRDAGITIAFPQRDVHLDTTKPLEIKLHAAEVESESRTFPIRHAA